MLRAAPQTADTILAAARSRTVLAGRVPRPPAHVLGAWLAVQPWTDIDAAGDIRATADVSTSGDRLDALAGELRRHPGGAATSRQLRGALAAAGYRETATEAVLFGSPIIEHVPGVRRGLYWLRCAPT